MDEMTIVVTKCVFLGYEGDARMYAFPGAYRYRRDSRGNSPGQLFINGSWRTFQPGEETAFREI